MQYYTKIAIIPAKGNSSRLPFKNVLPVRGMPLFMYSVFYAMQEGYYPLVSSDSEEVFKICDKVKVSYFKETVDDSKQENCINQILEEYSCEKFAILQPTSLFREPGLLREMEKQLDDDPVDTLSRYTAEKIKVTGEIDGKFFRQHRAQDATRFLYHNDGNIILVKTEEYKNRKVLLDDTSKYVIDKYPTNIQIDTLQEYNSIQALLLSDVFIEYVPSTPVIHAPQAKKLCIVSNKEKINKNHSAFIDSCDVVVRLNKLCNYDSGKTGTKTDIAMITAAPDWFNHDETRKHYDVLKKVPRLIFKRIREAKEVEVAKELGIAEDKIEYIPNNIMMRVAGYTTATCAMYLMSAMYPMHQIYFLGDLDYHVRVGPEVWLT